MNLSRLDIFGFKSFGSKSVLEFETDKKCSTITAIVGPNGSGKSNVADAIRWILGEQSTNVLRSKKSDDIIFCGSETKSRGSYAEATIYLTNNDPVEVEINNKKHSFTEIEITRKLFRTGDSEYLINHKKVRLLDIQELLASLGFGQSTYTVIGQGVVDRLLFFNAAERKVLFDEAAGVKQYKIKREQAIKKLLSTDENLVRLNDILAELEPRVTNLRRLVKRAESRKEIELELNENELQYYGSVKFELTSGLKQAEKRKNVLLVQVKELQEKVGEIKLDPEKNENYKKFDQKEQEIQSKIENVMIERDNLIRDIAFIQGQIEQAAKRKIVNEDQKNSLSGEHKTLIEKINFLSTKILENEKEAKERAAKKELLQTELSKKLVLIEKLEKDFQDKTKTTNKDKLIKIEDKINQLEEEKNNLSNQLYSLKQEEHLEKVKTEEDQKSRSNLDSQITNSEKDLISLEKQKNTLIDDGNKAKLKMIEIEGGIKEIITEIEKYEKILNSLGSEIEQTKINEIDIFITEIKAEHEAINNLFYSTKNFKEIKTLTDYFEKFSINFKKLLDKFNLFTRAINPKEREKLEKNISNLRNRLEEQRERLTEQTLIFSTRSTEIESINHWIIELNKVIDVKRSERKQLEQSTRKTDPEQINLLSEKLKKSEDHLERLISQKKIYTQSENELRNVFLTEKSDLQHVLNVLNNQIHEDTLLLTKKQNLIENQKKEKEHSRKRLVEIEVLLAEINQDKTENSDVKNIGELKSKKNELEKTELNLKEAKEKLNKIFIQKKESDQLYLNNERETHNLEKTIAELRQQISEIDLEKAKLSTREEDLEEEMLRAGIVFSRDSRFDCSLDSGVRDVLRAKIENLRRKKESIGGVDPETTAEYEELTTRTEEMKTQLSDLSKAKEDLEGIIAGLDQKIKKQFAHTFKDIADQFSHYFITLFNGGKAELKLGEDESGGLGVEIYANPPGKRPQSLNALSGGERTLTSLALLFAILSVNPSPFCILDEVDAALDESNTLRFIKILKELAKKTQFVVISHNRETMSAAELLYGVTMNENHTSTLVSIKLQEAERMVS